MLDASHNISIWKEMQNVIQWFELVEVEIKLLDY